MNIRPASTNDYPAIAGMMTDYRPDYPRTADNLLYEDDHRPVYCQHQLFVADNDGEIVGYSMYTQYADLYQLKQFHVMVYVRDDSRDNGTGYALYDAMYESVKLFSPEYLYTRVGENNINGFIFASKRGFMERSRRIESRLETANLNFDTLPERLSRLSAAGIDIRSYTELESDPERDKKLYTIHSTVDADVPMETPVIPLPYEQWRPNVIEHPQFVPDGTFVAIHEGRYVGISTLFQFVEDMAYVELTGTLPEYRRRGISTALKLCGIRYAQEQHIPRVGVTNDAVNEGIIAINKKLGFVPQPAIISLRLVI